jgi:hypothetical protein
MSGKNSKNKKVALDIYQVRTRKLEIAEGLFSCPFLSKRGAPCRVSQKYRSLKNHCKNMHEEEIALKCTIGDCKWACSLSIRCLTSHRDNLDNHSSVPYNGGENLDGTCLVVPFVLEDFPGEFIDGHSAQCVEAKISLKRFSGKMLKREERAAASAKLKAAALKKAFKKKQPAPVKPVVILLTKSPVKNPKFDAWMKTSLATAAVENSKKSKVIENIVVPVMSSKNSESTLEKEASPVVGVKRKVEISSAEKQEESTRPLKKRKSACDFDEQAMAGPSVSMVPSVVIVEAVPTPSVEVTQPKLQLNKRQHLLETKLNQMREGGFDKEDFMRLLRKFDLLEVLGLVAGENDFDQKNLRKSLANVAYQMLRGQATRFSLKNPVLFDK